MKVSISSRFPASVAAVTLLLLPFHSHADTFNTTDLFQISCVGRGFSSLDSSTISSIETIVWSEFASYFGAYTKLQPGESIKLTNRRRTRRTGEEIASSEDEAHNKVVEDREPSQKGQDETRAVNVVDVALPTTTERRLQSTTIQTCPNNCYIPPNLLVCAYNGCAVSGNGRTRNLRQLRGGVARRTSSSSSSSSTFDFNLTGCEEAMKARLAALNANVNYSLTVYITVYY